MKVSRSLLRISLMPTMTAKPLLAGSFWVDEDNFSTGIKGDQYQALYAGLNHYLYGHKLKIQTGVEYSWMQDAANHGDEYAGWSF